VKHWRPDVAHLHIFYGRLTSAVLPALREAGVPTVMSVHEHRILCPNSTMRDGKGRNCEKCANGARWHVVANRCNKGSIVASTMSATETYFRDRFFDYLNYIDRFLFVSRFCRDIHLKYRPEFADCSQVLYNFTSIAEQPATPSAGRHLLYMGRLAVEKGLHTLLAALSEVPDVKLRIAGTGPEEFALKQLASTFELTQRVEFLGYLEKPELSAAIRDAKFVVLPSECYENMPLSVIEAFAHGVPAIGADVGGIPELVEDGETGIVFKSSNKQSLAEALRRAACLPADEVDAMGRNAWTLVADRCNPDGYYRELLHAYQMAIEARGRVDSPANRTSRIVY
jgi:glycosyltransferase involved in cell wall biosynthesis